jgi:hypothetical protein
MQAKISMDDTRWISRYAATALIIVGGLEWLLGRTVSRMAAAPTLEGTPRDIIVTLGQIGLFLVSPAFLLAVCLFLVGLVALARRAAATSDRGAIATVCYLCIVGALLVAYTVLPTQDWLTTAFNILLWLALVGLALRFALQRSAPAFARVGVALAALGYSGWYMYVLGQQIGLGAQVGEQLGVWSISLGELLAVLTPVMLFFAVALPGAKWRHPRRWIAPVALALIFSGGNIADSSTNMGFTGVFTTWSLGLNIAWPWPLYAISLALYVYSVITCFSVDSQGGYANYNTGTGLILLLLAGYNLQTSYQHLLALLALALLSGLFRPFPVFALSNREAPTAQTSGRLRTITPDQPARPH